MISESSLNHGWLGFLLAYAATATGLFIGLRHASRNTPSAALFSLALLAIPATLAGLIGWAILLAILPAWISGLPWPLIDPLALIFLFGIGVIAGRVLTTRHPSIIHQRGTRLSANADERPPRHARAHDPHTLTLTLAYTPIPPADETKHFKLIGTTGTGKSTAIRALLHGALARGDRAVIADPDGGYLERFYNPTRGDVILNPFHADASRWDLFAELTAPHDADQLARCLIPDEAGADPSWRAYARTFLTALLRQLHRAAEHDPAVLYKLLAYAPTDDLRDLLAETPAGPFLAPDNSKFFESVRSVANSQLAALEHAARQSTGTPLSVRQWVRAGQGPAPDTAQPPSATAHSPAQPAPGAAPRGVLFLPYRASEIAALRTLISTWMRLAIFEALNANAPAAGTQADQHLWFIIDELDALGPIDGLKDALARLRKFGGRCVLGLQSIAQVRGTYGDAEAQTIIENCANTLILRCSASEHGGTAEFASRLIGQREIIRRQSSRTHKGLGLTAFSHQTTTHNEQHITEHAVLASEIEQLPDFAGYLKIASQPEWRRVQIPIDKAQ